MTPLALVASIPMGCLITAILVVNNLRDIDTDRAAGKRTLAVRIGSEATRWEYTRADRGGLRHAARHVVVGNVAGRVRCLALATAPLAIVLVRQVWARCAVGRLNPVLGGTARLCLWFAVAFGAGIVL